MKELEPLLQEYYSQKSAETRDFSTLVDGSIRAIDVVQKQRAKRMFYGYSGMFIASGALFGWGLAALVHDMAASGIGQLVSMFFSDFNSISSYWSDFAMSLAENVPVMSISLVLAAAIACLMSFRAAFITRFMFTKDQKVYGKN
jgi:hypothetical protein